MIFFNALGKDLDDPSNSDWVRSIFSHSKAASLAKLHSTTKRKPHHKLLKKKREKASLEVLKKPLKYANESPPPNEDFDMVIDEYTPFLPQQEIEESQLSTLHKQISSYHTELNNQNEKIYELCKKNQSLEKHVENAPFSFKNTNAKNLKFFCGVEFNTFKWILVLVKPYV